MNGFFNFLKNLFSGILSIFGLGAQKAAKAGDQPKPVKRASGYFLELDQAKGVSNTPAKPAEKPVEIVPQPAAAVAQTTQAKAAPAEPAKPAAVAQALNLPQPKVVNFATTYLVPGNEPGGRRRPGANMNAYLNMAKQVKTQG